MSVQTLVRPATERQMRYIRKLQAEIGDSCDAVGQEISASEASAVIRELVEKIHKRNGTNGSRKINEARLGMAMKECYRSYTRWGRDVLGDRRKMFVEEVTDLYYLFTEIVERLEQLQVCPGNVTSQAVIGEGASAPSSPAC